MLVGKEELYLRKSNMFHWT